MLRVFLKSPRVSAGWSEAASLQDDQAIDGTAAQQSDAIVEY